MEKCGLIIEQSAKNTEIMLGYFLQKKVYQDLVFHIGDEGAYSRQPFL